jgi:hypothetical protein
MEGHNPSWLRVRGIGRDRLARYVAEFLSGAGYRVEESNDTLGGNPASRIVAELARPNPAVPSSLHHLEFRTAPTAGGSLLRWEAPTALSNEAEKSRALRFATELLSNLEQRIVLESRGTGKITREQTLPPFLPSAGSPPPTSGPEPRPPARADPSVGAAPEVP